MLLPWNGSFPTKERHSREVCIQITEMNGDKRRDGYYRNHEGCQCMTHPNSFTAEKLVNCMVRYKLAQW